MIHVRLDSMAIIVMGFIFHMQLTHRSSDNVVMTLMSAAKESPDVVQIRNVSTLREATNAHAQEVSLEIPLMDVFKCLECAQMVQFVTEMQSVNMLVETDIGETISSIK